MLWLLELVAIFGLKVLDSYINTGLVSVDEFGISDENSLKLRIKRV